MRSFTILTLLLLACGTDLTAAGQNVKFVTKQEPPPECTLVGTIEADGAFDCEPRVSSLENAMRNETARKKGNLLVLDVVVASQGQNGTCYKGTGRAYHCPKGP